MFCTAPAVSDLTSVRASVMYGRLPWTKGSRCLDDRAYFLTVIMLLDYRRPAFNMPPSLSAWPLCLILHHFISYHVCHFMTALHSHQCKLVAAQEHHVLKELQLSGFNIHVHFFKIMIYMWKWTRMFWLVCGRLSGSETLEKAE